MWIAGDASGGKHAESQLYMKVGWEITEAEQKTETQTGRWKVQEARMEGVPGESQPINRREITAFLDCTMLHVTDCAEIQAGWTVTDTPKNSSKEQMGTSGGPQVKH